MDDLVEWAREIARQQMPTQELVEKSGLWVMAGEIERLRNLVLDLGGDPDKGSPALVHKMED